MRTRLVVVLTSAVLLAGCSDVVDGKVAPASSSRSGPSTDTPSTGGSPGTSSPNPSSAPVSSPSPTPTAGSFPRAARTSAIGDPATADLCGGLPLRTFRGLGYVAAAAVNTYPPNCIVRLTKGAVSVFDVSAYVTLGNTARATRGRKAARLSGLTTYTYPVTAALGDCEHDIVATGVTVVVQTFALGRKNPKVQCAATTAAVKQVAASIAGHKVPRISLADPSVTSIDFCAALKATDFRSLASFGSGTISADDATAGCKVVHDQRYLYVDNVVGTDRPANASASQVGGHAVYRSNANTATDCAFTVVQGRTSTGRYEQVKVSAQDSSSGSSPTLCADTEKVAVEFLDEAGLK